MRWTAHRLALILVLYPCPGMRFVVYLGKVLEVKVCIDLGRTDVRVSEKLLYSAQIAAGLEQVGRKRMPEHMRVYAHVDSLAPGPIVNSGLHRAFAESGAFVRDKQGLLLEVGQLAARR